MPETGHTAGCKDKKVTNKKIISFKTPVKTGVFYLVPGLEPGVFYLRKCLKCGTGAVHMKKMTRPAAFWSGSLRTPHPCF